MSEASEMQKKEIDPTKPLYVLECSESVETDTREKLEKLWADHFPGQQMIILDRGLSIKLLPASNRLLADQSTRT